MEFRILGPLEVARDGRALQLGGTRQRALLALLILRANEVVSSDALVDRLWGERAPATAGKALQVYVSRLRKALGREALATRPPGYVLHVESGELDLHVFEELVVEAGSAEPARASELLREALALWRGPALADLAYESFAQAEIGRLEELRLTALEERAEVDLALGRHAAVAAELEALVSRNPLRERLRGQLMIALYRSGRQAEALDAYQDARRLLDDELGLEPSETLKSLQRAILEHDPALEGAPAAEGADGHGRSILVAPRAEEDLDALLSLAEPLARAQQQRGLVLAGVVEPVELGAVTAVLRERRAELAARGVVTRAAAFSSPAPGEDLARLGSQHDADLLLLAAGPEPLDDAGDVLARASCDVALLLSHAGPVRPGPVVVPFGAAEHDWAALELGAWMAQSTDEPLRLVGAASDTAGDGRDASRLLADASLIVQRIADVVAEPLLATPGREGVHALAEGAGLLVVGLSERWRREGLGRVRAAIAESPPAPTVFVRRGLRPGGLAPAETRTRFTWSLTSAAPAR